MAGFENDIMFALNGDFSQADNQTPAESNGLVTNGQLWIGSTATNVGGTHINVGTLTSPGSSISIGYATPNITLAVGQMIATTYTADSGSATPASNNLNIFGLSGSKTSATGSTVTVKSPPYTDQGGSTTVTLNSGSFATSAITLTTPATAGLADGDLLEFVATSGVLIIQLAATQVAHIGNTATSVAGTLTSTATGDAVCLRYQASTNDWWATSVIGNWVLA